MALTPWCYRCSVPMRMEAAGRPACPFCKTVFEEKVLDKKLTVAVDLDGVLAAYDGWKGIEVIGAPLPGAQTFVARLAEMCRVLVFTTRCKELLAEGQEEGALPFSPDRRPAAELAEIVWKWLREHGFEGVAEVYVGQGKPFAVAYIDDRAVACRPQTAADVEGEFFRALWKVRQLVEAVKSGDLSDTPTAAEGTP